MRYYAKTYKSWKNALEVVFFFYYSSIRIWGMDFRSEKMLYFDFVNLNSIIGTFFSWKQMTSTFKISLVLWPQFLHRSTGPSSCLAKYNGFPPLKLDVKRLSCLSELCKSNNSSKLSEILLAEMKRGAARENTKVRNLTLSISTLHNIVHVWT